MSLIDNMMKEFAIMDKQRVPDGEGGFTVEWTEGAHIQIALVNDTSMRSQIAEAIKNVSTYTMVMKKEVALDFNDVVKRISDGRIFKITSDPADGAFPDNASSVMNDYVKLTAEKWELTT